MNPLKIGLFGSNGHQIMEDVLAIPEVELVAVSGLHTDKLMHLSGQYAHYDSYDDLLQHPGIQAISICSPVREQQVESIRAALQKGMHVYAEKPLVMDAEHLTELLSLARSKQLILREMASTCYEPPYPQIKRIVEADTIGEVVQVFVQKSYPYAPWRPQDEAIDGGIILQAGIHAIRMAEFVASQQIEAISAIQTPIGNPLGQPQVNSQLQMAAQFQMQFTGGAIGVAIINYLHVASSNVWGNDRLIVFGAKGYVEYSALTKHIHVCMNENQQLISCEAGMTMRHFQQFAREVLGQPHQLMPIEQELHPLRVVLTARQSANQQGLWLPIC